MRRCSVQDVPEKGGYRLLMIEDGEEAGGGWFPYQFDEDGFDLAWQDAMDTGAEFVGVRDSD